MIRVIVPTMWKYPPFWEFVECILKVDVITEFVIINNDEVNTPNLEILKHPKISIINFGKNIYVNPAWNCGSMGGDAEILCMLNDDLIFDTKVFYRISKLLIENLGCFCLSENRPDQEYPKNTGEIQFVPFINHEVSDRYGYGVLFFIHRKNWIDIPDKLKVFFGDNFVFDQCYFRGLQNFMITNLFHYHAGAQTSANINKGNVVVNKEHVIYFNEKSPLLLKNDFKGLI